MLFQLLDVDYIFSGNRPIVRMFGRTDKGNSVCALYDRHSPYFYIKANEEQLHKIKNIKEIKQVEWTEKFIPLGYSEAAAKLLKIIAYNPQDVPALREKLVAEGIAEECYEADIMFKYRFLIDKKIHGMSWVEADGEKTTSGTVKTLTYFADNVKEFQKDENAKLRFMAFDIECVPTDTTKPLDAKKDPIVMISLAFEPEYKGRKTLVLVAKPVTEEGAAGFINENEMIEEFTEIIDDFDPDVITGYNINSFDIPYLLDRMKKLGLSATIGRVKDKQAFTKQVGASQETYVPGRIVLDPYQILRRDPWVKFHRYNLDTIARAMLGEEKLDVKYGEMPELWNGNKEQLGRFIEYSKKDALLSLRLVLEKGMLDKFVELAKISGLLLQDCFGGQSMRVETMIMHELRERNYVMPSKPSQKELNKRGKSRDKEGIKGATVLEPGRGLHSEGCVLVLDFKSLYPSVMRTFNISPDTLVTKKTEGMKTINAPNGAEFVEHSLREGIMPMLLTKLMETRAMTKRKMKQAKGEEERILNAKQLAIKDMSNSFYGYTGYVRARLYIIEVANAITAYGRENIMKTKDIIEKNFDVEVVYGDTDSIFLKTKIKNLDEVKNLGDKIAEHVTKNLPGHLELQFEKIYRTFLILSKKRYAGWKFEMTESGWKDDIEMKGIETVRRDWCLLVPEVMESVIETILKEGDLQKAIEKVRSVIEDLRNNKVPLEKLTIVKGVTKSIDSYEGTLPHIELAKKLKARNPYSPPKIGDRLGFVIIRGNQMLSKRAEDPEYARTNSLHIDSDYYINSQVFPPVERIFTSLGIDKNEVLGLGRQMSLGDLMNGNKRKMKHEISVDYNQALEGYEGFECKKCSKSFSRPPLSGSCECGGELQITYHGSSGDKVAVR